MIFVDFQGQMLWKVAWKLTSHTKTSELSHIFEKVRICCKVESSFPVIHKSGNVDKIIKVADFFILLICNFRQYKVVNIANFVYYGKTRICDFCEKVQTWKLFEFFLFEVNSFSFKLFKSSNKLRIVTVGNYLVATYILNTWLIWQIRRNFNIEKLYWLKANSGYFMFRSGGWWSKDNTVTKNIKTRMNTEALLRNLHRLNCGSQWKRSQSGQFVLLGLARDNLFKSSTYFRIF